MSVEFIIGDAASIPRPNQSVDLVAGSPPYTDRRDYGINAKRDTLQWINWMLKCTQEGLRVSRGPVVWVVNGCVKRGHYQPAVEGLLWEAYKSGIRLEHPLIWSKNATPNRKDWWCNGWEYIIAFGHSDGRKQYFDWEAVATPQKYAKGGVFRQRGVDGKRKFGKDVPRSKLARPYDLIRATVGGGHMGHNLAHENEAPFPCSLLTQIIPALVPIGGLVLDPFSGSGTTGQVCIEHGRNAICMDVRESQRELGTRRCEGVQLKLVSVA